MTDPKPADTSASPTHWTIRGVAKEHREAAGKYAIRHDLTMGEAIGRLIETGIRAERWEVADGQIIGPGDPSNDPHHTPHTPHHRPAPMDHLTEIERRTAAIVAAAQAAAALAQAYGGKPPRNMQADLARVMAAASQSKPLPAPPAPKAPSEPARKELPS